jgi:hypothetical protein
MNGNDIESVEVPERLLSVLGEADEGTRMFRRYGTEEDFQEWWEAVAEICAPEGAVSPGGVSMYARVTRAGVHKRMKEGRITAFLFHKVTGVTRWTKREILDHAGEPYIYIPGRECRAWAELLGHLDKKEQRREEVGDGDLRWDFLRARGRKVQIGRGK